MSRLFSILVLIFALMFVPTKGLNDAIDQKQIEAGEQPAAGAVIPQEPPCPVYSAYAMPAYAREFLGADYGDYCLVVDAIENGDRSVQLNDPGSFSRVERALNALYPGIMLLTDADYRQGRGPFTLSECTGTLTIGYQYDTETHRTLIEALHLTVSEDLSVCLGMHDPGEMARALYGRVTEALTYEDDRSLTIYDAVTTRRAFCRTYAGYLQYLLANCNIESYLVGGNVDTDGDGASDGAHAWLRVVIGGDSFYCDPTWELPGHFQYYGMNEEACILTGHLTPFTDPVDPLLN